jgi:hypothetical protein
MSEKVSRTEWREERKKLITKIEMNNAYNAPPKWECVFCGKWFNSKDIYTHLQKRHKEEAYTKIAPQFHYILDLIFKAEGKQNAHKKT